MNAPTSGRIPQLDLLRGIAVLMVILCHYPYFGFLGIGWAGVDLFFVLSGFLISGLLFSDWKRNGKISIKRFFVRRGFKIYPAFYFFLLTTAGSILLTDTDKRGHALSRFSAELFFLQDYFPHVWGHTWSLAIEEQFYILLPLLLLLIAKFHKSSRPFAAVPVISVVLAVACLALRVSQHPASLADVVHELHFRADTLFAGVALGYLFHFRGAAFRAMSRWWLLPIGLVALIPLCLYRGSGWFAPYILTCNTVGFACLLLWIVPRSNVRAALIERIGVYSYSIYLWHIPADGFFRDLHPPRFIWLLLYVATSILLGTFMGRLIELRALAVRERLFPADAIQPREGELAPPVIALLPIRAVLLAPLTKSPSPPPARSPAP